MKKETDEIKRELLKIQTKRRRAFLMMICFLPTGVFLAYILDFSPFAGVLSFIYLIFTSFLFIQLSLSKCPRCHKSFFHSSSWANVFTNKYLNCGINFKV